MNNQIKSLTQKAETSDPPGSLVKSYMNQKSPIKMTAVNNVRHFNKL